MTIITVAKDEGVETSNQLCGGRDDGLVNNELSLGDRLQGGQQQC